MPPSDVGAIRHSIRRIGSGMSKCTSAISLSVRSASSCIHAANASLPTMRRAGSASSASTASSIVPARDDLVGDLRHLVLDAGELVLAPVVGLLEVDRGAEEVAGAAAVHLAPTGLGPAAAWRELVLKPAARLGGRLARRLGVPGEQLAERPLAAGALDEVGEEVAARALLARPLADLLGHLRDLPPAATCPDSAASSRVVRLPSRAAGNAASRASMLFHAVSSEVSMISSTDLISCRPLSTTDSDDCGTFASYISTSSPSRSRNASLATCSRSSTGVAAVTAASARGVSSFRAANPSGE